MRRSELGIGLSLVTLCGCTPRSEFVSIDLAAVPLSSKTASAPLVRVTDPGPGTVEARLPDLPARNVFVGSGKEIAERAVKVARKNQDEAYRQALAELRDAYRAEAAAHSNEVLSARRKAFESRFNEVYGALRLLFDEHAERVGPLWTRLAVLKGFPVGPGKVKPSAEAVFFGRDENKIAEHLKKEIAAADADYRTEVARRVEALRHEWRGIQTDLEAERIVALDEAEQRAMSDAQKLVTDILKGLEQSMIKDIQRLPAVPGSRVKVDALRVSEPKFPAASAVPWDERDRLQRRADLFARVSGYRLVKSGPGVRDVTKDFLEWDKKNTGR